MGWFLRAYGSRTMEIPNLPAPSTLSPILFFDTLSLEFGVASVCGATLDTGEGPHLFRTLNSFSLLVFLAVGSWVL